MLVLELHQAGILVENQIVLEVKSVEGINDVHPAEVLT
ncbi:GxxExxY protein [Emticicia sp. 17c]